MFNYVANIIRAKNDSGEKISNGMLKRKLLSGLSSYGIESICDEGLTQLSDLLHSGKTGMEYRPYGMTDLSSTSDSAERDALLERKRKAELAMNRLKSLYLYGEESMPEKDFIIERKKIQDRIDEIDKALSLIQTNSDAALAMDDEFVEKASYFMMVEKILSSGFINYEKYIRGTDPSIPKAFIRTIISSIEVTEGNVTAINFKNGMTHTFTYKDSKKPGV